MPKVLIVYYSGTGNTETMAAHVAEGARIDGVDVELKKVGDMKADELLHADGIIVGSPVYYGLMSAQIKQLFDESVKFHGRLTGKVGGGFASSANIGGGNEVTILSILQMMLIHGMIVQGTADGDHYGPVAIGPPDERSTPQCIALGRRVAELVSKLAT
ncbi:MAG: NAD(P)H-dependent oxidoreductase [Armatimonadota bacterium]|jgi:NAD(P)H dehydrogenase (quinone)